MLHFGGARVDEFAFDADGADAFLKFHSKVCGVGWVFLLFSKFGSVVVEQVNRGVV